MTCKSLYTIHAVLTLSVIGCQAAPKDRNEGWRRDLSTLAIHLPQKHPDFFRDLDKKIFQQELTKLDAEIENLSDPAIVTRMQALIAMAGDSHTGIRNRSFAGNMVPLKLFQFDDGLRVLAAPKEHKDLVGQNLVAIEQTNIDEVLTKVRPFVAAENDAIHQLKLPQVIVLTEVLNLYDVASSREEISMTFTDHDGKESHRKLTTMAAGKMVNPATYLDRSDLKLPMAMENTGNPYWSRYLPEQQTMFVQYNSCRNKPLKSFKDFSQDVFKQIDEKDAQRVIIDLRYNGGGNSAIANPMIDQLAKHEVFNKRGNLFVLIGRQTFSSALINAVHLKEKAGAILVGEPTGGAPNHFGEVRTFNLPISKLVVRHSTKFFRMWPNRKGHTLEPDIHVPQKWSDFTAGKDVALETCLEFK